MYKWCSFLLFALVPTLLPAQGPTWNYYNYKDSVDLSFYSAEIAIYDPTPPLLRRTETGHRQPFQLPNGDVVMATHLSDGWSIIDLSPMPSGEDPVAYALSVINDYATDPGDDIYAAPIFGSPTFKTVVGPEIHVGFEFDVPQATVDTILQTFDVDTVLESHWMRPNIFRVTNAAIRSGVDLLDVANSLALHPDVRYAVTNWVYMGSDLAKIVVEYPPAPLGALWSPPSAKAEPLVEGCFPMDPSPPNDPLWFASWHLEQAASTIDLDALRAWDVCTGDGVGKVYVLDTGIEQGHEDLAGNILEGADFTSDCPVSGGEGCKGYARDLRCELHMTSVSGTIIALANNQKGTSGLTPNLKVVPVRIARYDYVIETGACEPRADALWAANGIDYVADDGGKVSSLSWNYGFKPNPDFSEAYQRAAEAGVINFNSAGNHYQDDIVETPGYLPEVHSISGIDPNGDRMYVYPGFGSNIGADVDFAGPARFVPTTDLMGQAGYSTSLLNYGYNYTSGNGTSLACPLAAAIAAGIFVIQPSWGPYEAFEVMKKTAQDLRPAGWDTTSGHGLINAGDAWEYASRSIFFDGFEKGTSRWSEVSGEI